MIHPFRQLQRQKPMKHHHSVTSRRPMTLAVSAALLLLFSSVSYAAEQTSIRNRLLGGFRGLRNLQDAGAPPTAAPPTSAAPPGCGSLLADFQECIAEGSDACFCDDAPSSTMPREQCDEFNGWYGDNFSCCLNDVCGAELEALKECKQCPDSALPPTASAITPEQPMESIAEIVVNDSRLGTLNRLLEIENLDDDLEGDGPLTLFAPTDDAFALLNLRPGNLPENLMSILLYHVVGNLVEPLENGKEYATLANFDVVISVTAAGSKVNDANIDDTVRASNGIV